MIHVKIFSHNRHSSHYENHLLVLGELNEFLESCEEENFAYLNHTTHFLEGDRVTIEVAYRKIIIREVLFEKKSS
jgi:hypothetical protein